MKIKTIKFYPFSAEDSYIGNHIGEEGGTESEVRVISYFDYWTSIVFLSIK